jgi:hypothetical protein
MPMRPEVKTYDLVEYFNVRVSSEFRPLQDFGAFQVFRPPKGVDQPHGSAVPVGGVFAQDGEGLFQKRSSDVDRDHLIGSAVAEQYTKGACVRSERVVSFDPSQ